MARSLISTLLTASVVLSTLASVVSSNKIFIKPYASLPSLESLGVTPAQLYDMAVNTTSVLKDSRKNRRSILARDELHLRSGAYTDHCDGRLCAPAGYLAAIGCAEYMRLVPDALFHVDRTFQVLCEATPVAGTNEPRALIIGYGIVTNPLVQLEGDTTSAARDVANAVFWIRDNCPKHSCNDHGQCGISGTAAATGNGDFLVYVASEIVVEGRC